MARKPALSRFPDVVVRPFVGWGSDPVVVNIREEFEAVSIGAQSEAVDAYIFAEGAAVPLVLPQTGTSRERFGAHHVAVRSPYVGRIVGPLTIAPRYSNHSQNSPGARLGIISTDYEHLLELHFHRVTPPVFAIARPDAHYFYSSLSSIPQPASDTVFLRAPAYGRADATLRIRAGVTSGAMAWGFYGVHVENGPDRELLGAGSFTTVTSETYHFSGAAFDFYEWQVTGGGAATGASARASITLRDP